MAFRSQGCILITPGLEFCPIILMYMSKIDRTAIENVHRAFTRNLLGTYSSLGYRARCELRGHEKLCSNRVELNLAFFFILCLHNVHCASNVIHDTVALPHPHCSRYYSVVVLWLALPSIGAKSCTIAYSSRGADLLVTCGHAHI